MNRVRALLISFLGAAVLMAALSYDAVLWAQDFAAGFPGGGGRGIGLLNALYCQLASPCVLTGDNASGTGTLRIRPSDEDTQLVLCEASNNSSPEMCSSFNHVNATATSFLQMTTNGYMNSASAWTRFNTSAGTTGIYTQASTTNASNVIGQILYSTNNTISGSALFAVTGAGTSTYTIGQNGTVTTDFRGPIRNGGSATCNGLLSGALCINENSVVQYAATASSIVQSTDATAAAYHGAYDTAGTLRAAFAYANSSVADSDLADKTYAYSNGKTIGMLRADDVAAGTMAFQWMDNVTATGVQLASMNGDGRFAPTFYGSQSNCSDGAGAAACSAAPAGSVVIDAAGTTVVVSTTAVTANSQIFVQEDSSLGTKLSVTCNTTTGRDYTVSARTAATSFTITASAAPVTNPACLSYFIVN